MNRLGDNLLTFKKFISDVFVDSKLLIPLSLLTLTTACSEVNQPKISAKNLTDQGDSSSQIDQPEKRDPLLAKVTLAGNPSPSLMSENSSIRVPSLGITLQGADYVEIVRCAASYVIKTPSGEDVRIFKESDPDMRRQILKRTYVDEVKSNPNVCRIVGTKVVVSQFLDYAARPGSYYYVLNPCVMAERSTSGRDDCSYDILVTDQIQHITSVHEDFLKGAEDLARLESTLSGYYNQLNYYAERARKVADDCESSAIVAETARSRMRGFSGLVLAGVGAAVGGVVTGGNPAAALKGAETGLGLAMKLFSMYQPQPQECPGAQRVMLAGQSASGKIPDVQQQIIDARKKLAQLDSDYGGLDGTISQQNSGVK